MPTAKYLHRSEQHKEFYDSFIRVLTPKFAGVLVIIKKSCATNEADAETSAESTQNL